jgi:uncharacterized protein YqeY
MSTMLRERLQTGLIDAMKRRDTVAVRALRAALSAIANAEAVAETIPTSNAHPIAGSVRGLGAGDTARRELSELEVLDIVDAEIEGRLASAAQYDELDQSAAADRLRAQARVLRSCLEP